MAGKALIGGGRRDIEPERQRLLGDVIAEAAGGLFPALRNLENEMDPIGDVEIRLAPRLLHDAHDVARLSFSPQLRVELEVEYHDGIVGSERLTGDVSLRSEQDAEVPLAENLADDFYPRAIEPAPLARLRRSDDLLHLHTEALAQSPRVYLQPEARIAVELPAEDDLLHVDLVPDQIG